MLVEIFTDIAQIWFGLNLIEKVMIEFGGASNFCFVILKLHANVNQSIWIKLSLFKTIHMLVGKSKAWLY